MVVVDSANERDLRASGPVLSAILGVSVRTIENWVGAQHISPATDEGYSVKQAVRHKLKQLNSKIEALSLPVEDGDLETALLQVRIEKIKVETEGQRQTNRIIKARADYLDARSMPVDEVLQEVQVALTGVNQSLEGLATRVVPELAAMNGEQARMRDRLETEFTHVLTELSDVLQRICGDQAGSEEDAD